jgi:hypothetical protein
MTHQLRLCLERSMATLGVVMILHGVFPAGVRADNCGQRFPSGGAQGGGYASGGDAQLPWDPLGALEVPGPTVFRVRSITPNPTTGLVRIVFDLPRQGAVAMEIFDAGGRRVRQVCTEPYPPGTHQLSWDGCDEGQRAVPAGVYFLRSIFEGRSQRDKVVVIQ